MANRSRKSTGTSRGQYDRDWERSRGEGYRGEAHEPERPASEFEGGYGRGEYERGGYGRGFRGEYGGEYGSPGYGGYGAYGRGGEFGGRSDLDYGYGGRPGLSGGESWGGHRGAGYGAGTGRTDVGTEWGLGRWGPTGMQGGYGPGDIGRTEPARIGRGMRGRGPKGFRRSDESIRERVSELLEQDDDIDATEIEVQVNDGEVTLSGTVEDRWAKRRCEELIENLPGVKEVHNQLRIGRGEQGERERAGRSRREAAGRSGGEGRAGTRR